MNKRDREGGPSVCVSLGTPLFLSRYLSSLFYSFFEIDTWQSVGECFYMAWMLQNSQPYGHDGSFSLIILWNWFIRSPRKKSSGYLFLPFFPCWVREGERESAREIGRETTTPHNLNSNFKFKINFCKITVFFLFTHHLWVI